MAFRATGLAGSGDILAAGSAQTASRNPPESRRAAVPDAWFDHAAGVIMVRQTCRLPRTARGQSSVAIDRPIGAWMTITLAKH